VEDLLKPTQYTLLTLIPKEGSTSVKMLYAVYGTGASWWMPASKERVELIMVHALGAWHEG
jgi:hypothetical protein